MPVQTRSLPPRPARDTTGRRGHADAGGARRRGGLAAKEVAAKYRGKAGAQERLITHLTTGEKAKFADGHEEEHKIIKAPNKPDVVNLVD